MGQRRAATERRRDAEFSAFTAGAAGRLLHAATLLTGDPAEAERLLCAVLARVYADWFRMRAEDPYEQARTELVRRFAHRLRWQRPHGGVLDRLTAQERLVVVLRLFEGVAEEQAAAQLGLPADRVRAICSRAMATLRSRPARQSGPPPSGPTDSGPTNSGPTNSGPTNSGPTNSGPTDSGPPRSGPPPSSRAQRADKTPAREAAT